MITAEIATFVVQLQPSSVRPELSIAMIIMFYKRVGRKITLIP